MRRRRLVRRLALAGLAAVSGLLPIPAVTRGPAPLPAWAGSVTALVRDPAGKPLADAVVYAIPAAGGPAAPARAARAVIDQVDREFVPRVKPIQAGTEMMFPNKDNIRHHVYSFSPAKTFELPLYTGTPARPVVFDRPGLVILGCNIHDWMLGYVLVLETPWFETTGADGVAGLANLPAGGYDVRVWHPLMQERPEATGQRLALSGSGSAPAEFTITLKPEWRPRRLPGRPGDRYR